MYILILVPIFPCSVCTVNVPWRVRSVQCCTCSKWVHLRCSLLSFSRFKTLGSSHSWSCPPWCTPASSGVSTPNNSLGSSSLYTSTIQTGLFGPPLLMQRSPSSSYFLPSFIPLRIFSFCTLSNSSRFWMFLYTSCFLFLS